MKRKARQGGRRCMPGETEAEAGLRISQLAAHPAAAKPPQWLVDAIREQRWPVPGPLERRLSAEAARTKDAA